MQMLDLPVHPSRRHPLTGEPIRAVYVDKHGRARYGVAGGAPDDPPKQDPPKQDDPPKDPPKQDDPPKPDPPKNDPPKDLGFPRDTPVAEMTTAQQAAYWRHNSQKHEERNRGLLKLTGGKYGDDLAADMAELAKLRTAQLSDGEKAVEQAKTEGRREASLSLVPQMFDVALAHVDDERRKVLISSIDKASVLNDDGTIDTDKVSSIAAALAPADKGTGGEHDYGQGRRGAREGTGVSAGRTRYQERHGKKQDA